MARRLRIHAPGAMYHVTLRGNHRQDIFFSAADRERLNLFFADALARLDARLHAYCHMSNHIHALIQVGEEPLGRLIMPIASRYARETQARLSTTGHLFERRYHSVLVDADSYFIALLRYIHMNPVAAGLASSPDEYPWSSHHAYAGTRVESWLTTDFGLSLFSSDAASAMRAYRIFIADGLEAEPSHSPFDSLNPSDGRILGSDDFARKMLGAKWRPRSRKTLSELISEAARHFNVDEAQLISAGRAGKLVAARTWIVKQAVAGGIASISEVARQLNRDESSMRYALRTCADDV